MNTASTASLNDTFFPSNGSSWGDDVAPSVSQEASRSKPKFRAKIIDIVARLANQVPNTGSEGTGRDIELSEFTVNGLEGETMKAILDLSRIISGESLPWTGTRLERWMLRTVSDLEEAEVVLSGSDQVGIADQLVTNIKELAELPHNWDGEAAEAIATDAIDAAIDLVRLLCGEEDIALEAFADPDGSVGLVGRFGQSRMLINVAGQDTIAYVIKDEVSVQRGRCLTTQKFLKLLGALR